MRTDSDTYGLLYKYEFVLQFMVLLEYQSKARLAEFVILIT